jgi:hypothetical protein
VRISGYPPRPRSPRERSGEREEEGGRKKEEEFVWGEEEAAGFA